MYGVILDRLIGRWAIVSTCSIDDSINDCRRYKEGIVLVSMISLEPYMFISGEGLPENFLLLYPSPTFFKKYD